MNIAPRPRTSAPRLRRLSLRLALMLAWFAAHVVGIIAPRKARAMLDHYARRAMAILVLMALRRVILRRRPRGAAFPAKRHNVDLRRAAGAMLRRALRKGDLGARARAIAALLAAPERWVRHIIRRLKRGFTRLARLPAPQRTHIFASAAAPPCAGAINSS